MKNYLLFFLVFFIAASCDQRSSSDQLPEDIVAVTSGYEIGLDEFLQEKTFFLNSIANLRNANISSQEINSSVLDSIINERIVYQAAKEANYTASEAELSAAVEAAMSAYPSFSAQGWLDDIGISLNFWREKVKQQLTIKKFLDATLYDNIKILPAEIEGYYDDNKKNYLLPDRRTVLHLQVNSVEVENLVLSEIKKGRPFEQLIDTYSIALDRHNNGELKDIPNSYLPEDFSKEIFKTSKGSYTSFIKSEQGSHIFKIIEIQPATQQKLSEVESAIKQTLIESKSRSIYNVWFDNLKSQSHTVINKKLIDSLVES